MLNLLKTSLTIIIELIIAFTAFGQNDSIGIHIPQSDSSPFSWTIKHMWVGIESGVFSNYIGSDDIIRISTNNGKIVKSKTEDGLYYIIPKIPGEVKVTTLMRIWKGNLWDTIKTSNSFTAITPPKIITVLDENFLKDSLDILYHFIEASTKKENERYQLGALPRPILVYRKNKKIGEIEFFTERDDLIKLLVIGNKLHFPSYVIRDMETGLLLGTPEFDYVIK
jgi:hypothetical protein